MQVFWVMGTLLAMMQATGQWLEKEGVGMELVLCAQACWWLQCFQQGACAIDRHLLSAIGAFRHDVLGHLIIA